ncbi:MAG: hypothetical protein LQ339_002218 [Xanthoria mediterranea]|nr:MAG: hypothetical protein LQ339_002218 [Xanthoria mediterranea]
MAKHVKITEDGFKIGIGFMLAVAVSLALGRIFVRAKLNRKVYVDDGFFFLALVTLVAGTVMTYIDIPYIYLQQNVQAGTQAPPADFIQQLLKSVKIQDAAVVLLSATVFAVKLAFLAFFRGLIRRLKKLEMWWWFVLVIVVISSLILICANFITCPYFDERILVKCVSPSALKRQNATLRAVSILDILSDVFIISIPIALLWRVRIDLRRKLALGGMLCLSVFTIITVIVKISGGNTNNGQIDSSWVIFWLQMEAAVAVMVASIIAYRALFVVERSRTQDSPRYISWVRAKVRARSNHSQDDPAFALQNSPSGRGSLPFKNRKAFPRRPRSACEQNSPSYQDGVNPRSGAWDFRDDTIMDLRPPPLSSGYPYTGPPIALSDLGNHQNGDLPPVESKNSTSEQLRTTSRSEEVGAMQRSSKSAEHSRDLNQVTYL